MKVLSEERKGVAVLRLRGKLLGGPGSAASIGDAIRSVSDQGWNNVLLDLGEIQMVNGLHRSTDQRR